MLTMSIPLAGMYLYNHKANSNKSTSEWAFHLSLGTPRFSFVDHALEIHHPRGICSAFCLKRISQRGTATAIAIPSASPTLASTTKIV